MTQIKSESAGVGDAGQGRALLRMQYLQCVLQFARAVYGKAELEQLLGKLGVDMAAQGYTRGAVERHQRNILAALRSLAVKQQSQRVLSQINAIGSQIEAQSSQRATQSCPEFSAAQSEAIEALAAQLVSRLRSLEAQK